MKHKEGTSRLTHDDPHVAMVEGAPAVQHDVDGVGVVQLHLGLQLLQGLGVDLVEGGLLEKSKTQLIFSTNPTFPMRSL